jgi:hypothetical protein
MGDLGTYRFLCAKVLSPMIGRQSALLVTATVSVPTVISLVRSGEIGSIPRSKADPPTPHPSVRGQVHAAH